MTDSLTYTGVGVITCGLVAWMLFRNIQFYCFPHRPALLRYRRSPERSWAIITGASAGIGYGFAQELISHGFGVVLLASRKQRLDDAAEKLRAEFPGAAVQTVVFDATNVNGAAIADALVPAIQNLPLTVLVNNVGTVTVEPYLQSLDAYTSDDVVKTINLSSVFMTQLTRIMIPYLDRNGPSVVINMASKAQMGGPWIVLYAACKAFVTSFSAGLSREAKAVGWKISSVSIVAGEVYTEFKTEGLPPLSPTSRDFARMTLDRIEMAVDRSLWAISPYWFHAFLDILIDHLPEWVVQYLLVKNTKEKIAIIMKGR